MDRFEVPDVLQQKERQKRHLVELKLNYEGQLDEKERELARLKEKVLK